jgi:hypothetical protein
MLRCLQLNPRPRFLLLDIVRAYFDKIAIFGDLDLHFVALVLLDVSAVVGLAVFRFLFDVSDSAARVLMVFCTTGGKSFISTFCSCSSFPSSSSSRQPSQNMEFT